MKITTRALKAARNRTNSQMRFATQKMRESKPGSIDHRAATRMGDQALSRSGRISAKLNGAPGFLSRIKSSFMRAGQRSGKQGAGAAISPGSRLLSARSSGSGSRQGDS